MPDGAVAERTEDFWLAQDTKPGNDASKVAFKRQRGIRMIGLFRRTAARATHAPADAHRTHDQRNLFKQERPPAPPLTMAQGSAISWI